MEAADISKRYPTLFHMAEAGSWESIAEHGLLSTEALVDLFEVNEGDRKAITAERRQDSVPLDHPELGHAVVRDQKPLSESALTKCLTDMTLEEWLRVLNSRVFFWLTEDRLERLLGAKMYRDAAHDVIHVDTAKLLALKSKDITLSPMNSGSTIFRALPRGSDTFLPIADYPFEERVKARKEPIVELAVNGGVEQILQVANRVERRRPGRVEKVIWESRQ